jgi:hypothetical protein
MLCSFGEMIDAPRAQRPVLVRAKILEAGTGTSGSDFFRAFRSLDFQLIRVS